MITVIVTSGLCVITSSLFGFVAISENFVGILISYKLKREVILQIQKKI